MKELKRSRTDRMVAGVCGGIGEYLEIDPNVIRLVWVVVTVFSMGIGLLAYLLAWFIIPEEAPPITARPPTTGDVITVEPNEIL